MQVRIDDFTRLNLDAYARCFGKNIHLVPTFAFDDWLDSFAIIVGLILIALNTSGSAIDRKPSTKNVKKVQFLLGLSVNFKRLYVTFWQTHERVCSRETSVLTLSSN